MSDITMCPGEGCIVKETCRRFYSKPYAYLQSYFVDPPCRVTDSQLECEFYWNSKGQQGITVDLPTNKK